MAFEGNKYAVTNIMMLQAQALTTMCACDILKVKTSLGIMV